VQVKSEDAVTVQDVMQGLCDYYTRGASYDRCHYFFEGFFKGKGSTEKVLVFEAGWGS
jgi:predicted metalloprotease